MNTTKQIEATKAEPCESELEWCDGPDGDGLPCFACFCAQSER